MSDKTLQEFKNLAKSVDKYLRYVPMAAEKSIFDHVSRITHPVSAGGKLNLQVSRTG